MGTFIMVKAALLGAASGIGQPLALLLKQHSTITELALYDVVPVVKGVAADVSHVDTPAVCTGYVKDELKEALKGSDIVVIPAGVPRKPGMTRDDLFNINASIVRDLTTACAEVCPKAFVCIISNPVNSTVPIAVEVFKKAGVFDPKRIFGVTTLDVVRASTMSAQAIGKPTSAPEYKVPVVGGHAGKTILPLLSQAKPSLPSSLLSDKTKVDELIGAAFDGKKDVITPTYIYVGGESSLQSSIKNLDFFSFQCQLGPNGVEKILPLGQLNELEASLLDGALPELEGSIKKG